MRPQTASVARAKRQRAPDVLGADASRACGLGADVNFDIKVPHNLDAWLMRLLMLVATLHA